MPYDLEFEPGNVLVEMLVVEAYLMAMKALLVVDMQVGCFEGEPPRLDADGVVRRVNALADQVRRSGMVVFIRHTEPSGTFLRGSSGWQLLPSLQVEPGDTFVEKCACDAFLETGLGAFLGGCGVRKVIIAGCATDFCVDTTVRSAAARGFEVSVASDAHTTRDRPHLDASKIIEHHNFMWSELILPRAATVRVVPTKKLLQELQNARPIADTQSRSK